MNNQKKRAWWRLPLLLTLAVGTILIIRSYYVTHDLTVTLANGEDVTLTYQLKRASDGGASYCKTSGTVFGTIYNITYQGKPDIIRDIRLALDSVDNALSMFNQASNLSLVNQNRTAELQPMTRDVLTLATEVSRQTGGAFDITVAPLVNAWGFGFKNSALPDSAQVDSLRRHVGWQLYAIDGNRIVKADTLVMLDCSAIAKGYGCDVAARTLERHGVANYLVEIGGEMTLRGVNDKGETWTVGVSRPDNDGSLMSTIAITDCGIATSGNYRNYYTTDDGQTISHTIDPRTGYPARNTLLSATVVASTCVEADAYATAFMTMGIDSARAVVSRQPQLQVLFIYEKDGELQTYTTPTLEEKTRQ